MVAGYGLGIEDSINGGKPFPFHGEVEEGPKGVACKLAEFHKASSGGCISRIPPCMDTVGDGDPGTVIPSQLEGRVFGLNGVQDIQEIIMPNVGLGDGAIPFADLDEVRRALDAKKTGQLRLDQFHKVKPA